MLVRPDMCNPVHGLHGGAAMSLADTLGAMGASMNLPEGANGTTTLESKTNFIGAAREGETVAGRLHAHPYRPAHIDLADQDHHRGGQDCRTGDADPDGALDCPPRARRIRCPSSGKRAPMSPPSKAAPWATTLRLSIIPTRSSTNSRTGWCRTARQRDLDAILQGAERGSKLMERQIYDIHTVTELGDRVILEYTWTGYPRTPVGTVRAGEAMRARICQVIEYEDGLIIRQRNYDCFEPF